MTHMSHTGMKTHKHTASTENLTSMHAHTDTHSQACTHTFVHKQICTPEHKESHNHSFGKILSTWNVIPTRLHQDTHHTNAGSKTHSWGHPWCRACPRQIKTSIACGWNRIGKMLSGGKLDPRMKLTAFYRAKLLLYHSRGALLRGGLPQQPQPTIPHAFSISSKERYEPHTLGALLSSSRHPGALLTQQQSSVVLTEHTTTKTNRLTTFSHRTQHLQEKRKDPSHTKAVLFVCAQTAKLIDTFLKLWIISISKHMLGILSITWHKGRHCWPINVWPHEKQLGTG